MKTKSKANRKASTDKLANSVASPGKYKGSPVISLQRNNDDHWPFSFGPTKAALIVKHFEEIKAFSEKNPME